MRERQKVDWGRIMSCLAERRAERYPLERHLTLIEILAWIGKPDDLDWVDLCVRTAAATALADLQTGRMRAYKTRSSIKRAQDALLQAVLPPVEIARLTNRLANEALNYDYWQGVLQSFSLAHVLLFMVRFPKDRVGRKKASLNKAWWFFDKGGWAEVLEGEFKKGIDGKLIPKVERIPSDSLVKIWPKKAKVTPFLAALEWEGVPFFDFDPITHGSILKVDKLFAEQDFGLHFLRLASTFQSMLSGRLVPDKGKTTQSMYGFVSFPAFIETLDLEILELPAQDMAIVESYRAPQ
jgi:hypothetical protein